MDAAALVGGALDAFASTLFPSAATIEERMATQDNEGSEEETWSAVLEDVPCQLSAFFPGGGPVSEQISPDAESIGRELRAILRGDFQEVEESMRALIGGRVYDITGVERDSFALVTTLRLIDRELLAEGGS